MVQHLLFANKTYDTAKQAVGKNQIIRMNGYNDDSYVVYDITEGHSGLIYRLINLRTHRFGQCDLIRPLSEKFGIGYYYDDEKPRFMDAFEVAILRGEAEQADRQEQEERQKQQECGERICDRGKFIERFAPVAGDEANIHIKVQEATNDAPEAVAGNFIIVDYSEKALAVFGDTRPVKEQLMALGGRFNPKLNHEGGKHAGWIFSKAKENGLRNLLTVKKIKR